MEIRKYESPQSILRQVQTELVILQPAQYKIPNN